MIAPPSHIKDAIRAYYGPSEPPMSSLPPELLSSLPPSGRKVQASVLPAQGSGPLGVEAEAEVPPESGPVIEAREVTMPPPRKRSGARMVTVTLLDGTQVNLPAAGSAKTQAAGSQEGPTARDLVTALAAVANGADASEVLGDDVNWQGMFAALLSLLLKKHLLADWEFVEELKRLQASRRTQLKSE
jgi:hypothetical protein